MRKLDYRRPLGPLCKACIDNEIAKVKEIVEAGTEDINVRGGDLSFTPLMLAAKDKKSDVMITEYLLSKGADVHLTTNHGDNALTMVCNGGSRGICKMLLDAGAEINHKNRGGWTPLLLAVKHQHGECAKLLLDAGADCDMRNNGVCAPRGNTALEIMQLHRTITGGSMAYLDGVDILKILKEKTTEPSCVTAYKHTEWERPKGIAEDSGFRMKMEEMAKNTPSIAG